MFLVLVLGGYFRFTGNNWDSSANLHPDERFITMTGTAIEWPTGLSHYLDPHTSPLSPYNKNFNGYIYGTFPLFLVKALADAIDMGTYGRFNLVGRFMSACADMGTLLLLFFIGNRLFSRRRIPGAWKNAPGLIAAALYAVTVFPIQQSHFATMDNHENFFVMLTFLLLLKFTDAEKPAAIRLLILLSGLTTGLAAASKISGLVFVGIVAAAWLQKLLARSAAKGPLRAVLGALDWPLWFILPAYAVFRFTQPYLFANPNWLDFTIQPAFREALTFQMRCIKGEIMFPPQWQWVGTPAFRFPFVNLFLWAVGPFIGLAALAGLARLIQVRVTGLLTSRTWRDFTTVLLHPANLAIVWIVFVFLYRGGNFVKSIRYLITIIPFLTLLAAFALHKSRIAFLLVFIPSLLWATAFTHIYRRETTRLQASRWMLQNIPPHKTIANEHWDDALPVHVHDTPYIHFPSVLIDVYTPDTPGKIEHLHERLRAADFLILSSPRASATIGTMPAEFPVMTRYYHLLETGQLGFVPRKTFAVFPRLFGIEINTLPAEEAFWVFDHPPVRIYQKERQLDLTELRTLLQPGT